MGMPALALTDHDAVYGVVSFVNAAREHGLQLIRAGAASPGDRNGRPSPAKTERCFSVRGRPGGCAPGTAHGQRTPLSDPGGRDRAVLDVIVRPRLYARQRSRLDRATLLIARGILQRNGTRLSVLVKRFAAVGGRFSDAVGLCSRQK